MVADPLDASHLYLGAVNGWIYESHNRGKDWKRLALVGGRDGLALDSIVIDKANPKHILVGAWVLGSRDGGLYDSKDGGVTWSSDDDMKGQSIRALAASSSDPKIVIAGTLLGVYRSTDSGVHWKLISPEGSKELHEVESIAIDPVDPQIIYAGTWHLPWKTTDGGEHWKNIKEGIIEDSDVLLANIVLSASHNSYEDNGIKFFRHDGYKLDDQIENQIEQLVFTGEIDSVRPTAGKIGRATRIDDALGRYVEFAKRSFPRKMSLEKMRITVDVANGAAYKSTPCILRELGAEIIVAHNQPNGTNINAECGSTYPAEIQRLVRESSAQIGITHDGDADRVLLCDEKGELVDGDEILAIAAVDLLQAKQLQQETLVATVMSNFGLDEALGRAGGKVIRTKVGDRYVIEEMVARNLNLGGEQSGHMIFRDFTTTGDGIISALQILRIMKSTGKPLSELKRCLTKYPQAQRNLRVKKKTPLENLPEIMKLVGEAEKELSGKGRVLLRYSGTEPKIRLLIEGRELDKIDKQANRIADAIQNAIGSD